jgi:hypothetical protein
MPSINGHDAPRSFRRPDLGRAQPGGSSPDGARRANRSRQPGDAGVPSAAGRWGSGERSEVMTTYEFRVDGRLSDRVREAFCDMNIEELPAGARLYGEVTDESHLLGIIAQFSALGLIVVSAHRVAWGAP